MDTLIRKMTRQAYDLQKLRMATGLRIVAEYSSRNKASLTEPESASEEPLDEELDKEDLEALQAAASRKEEKLLKMIVASYQRVTDGIVAAAKRKHYKFDDVITSDTDLWFVENYVNLLAEEAKSFKRLEKVLLQDSFYTEWLSKVTGIGPAMAGIIISEFDPYKAKYPSNFWSYAGLDVVTVKDTDGNVLRVEGRNNHKDHLVDREYTTKDGTIGIKKSITYNPGLKAKLLAVLATSFLRTKNEKYVNIYNDYKHRQMSRPDVLAKKAPKMVAHKRAIRYMIKMFLIDLHYAWRGHLGLEQTVPYHEAKLGLTHGRDPSAER